MNARRPVPNTNSYHTNSYPIPDTCKAWLSDRVRAGRVSTCSSQQASPPVVRGAFLVRYFPDFSWPNSCRLRNWKKLIDFSRLTPFLTCIGRIQALWPTRLILPILIYANEQYIWARHLRMRAWNGPQGRSGCLRTLSHLRLIPTRTIYLPSVNTLLVTWEWSFHARTINLTHWGWRERHLCVEHAQVSVGGSVFLVAGICYYLRQIQDRAYLVFWKSKILTRWRLSPSS